MGRRNTRPKSYLQVFQWLNSFASVDSKKTLPCLGFIEYSPKDQVSLKSTIGSTNLSILHAEIARLETPGEAFDGAHDP